MYQSLSTSAVRTIKSSKVGREEVSEVAGPRHSAGGLLHLRSTVACVHPSPLTRYHEKLSALPSQTSYPMVFE